MTTINGKFYFENVLETIAKVITREFNLEVNKTKKRMQRYTGSYMPGKFEYRNLATDFKGWRQGLRIRTDFRDILKIFEAMNDREIRSMKRKYIPCSIFFIQTLKRCL